MPSRGFKGHSSWYFHPRNKADGGKKVQVSVTEEGEHGFIRLADRVPSSSCVTAGTPPQPWLEDGSRIHVRTDLHVGTYDEKARFHDEEAA